MSSDRRFLSLARLFGGVCSLLVFSISFAAETIVTKRINSAQRLLPLKKLTVGPDDQYNAAVDPAQTSMVFSRKADLVAHLRIQDLKSGEVKDLLPVNADSQEPTFAPDGKLAFTYFRFSARGDICYVPGPMSLSTSPKTEKEITCLKRPNGSTTTQRSSPFWKSSRELAYVERDIQGQEASVVSENIESGQREVLAKGKIWSASMRAGGRYLAYNELSSSLRKVSRRLVLKDLKSGQARVISLLQPGLSGFPVFSEKEDFLYFSHFMSDTNDDRAIDGADNAVVFRLPLATVDKTGGETGLDKEIFPEQLTSASNSCSFPRPTAENLYVTCAFEGSLDIYQMPLSGVVPLGWDQKLLQNAHETSRSYQDRILIINTMRFRDRVHPAAIDEKRDRALNERLLSNHLFADDTQAARFYVNRLLSTDPAFYQLLGLYLEARELKRAEPVAAVSQELKRRLLEIDRRIASANQEADFRATVRGLLRLFIGEPRDAEAFLKKTKSSRRQRPLERFFEFELASGVSRSQLPESLPLLIKSYQSAMSATEFSKESQVFYAFSFLRELAAIEKTRSKRTEIINNVISAVVSAGGAKEPLALLKSELSVLKINEAKTDEAKLAAYRDLDLLMGETRTDYFLRKALYVRAILNFAEAADFKFLTMVATNWLRYTVPGDVEFAYAREVFADANLDEAYENLGKGEAELAANFFYQSLSLTDDLESHFGYVQMRLAKQDRKTIDVRYQNLRNRQFIDDNMKFVEALLHLIDHDSSTSDRSEIKHLDFAISKLTAMEQDRDSPVRHLFLGYCYLDKMLRLANGADFDGGLFQSAHRHLMLAYDLGRDNDRIKASALMNLGLLHQRVQNHGLASKFFSLRKAVSFVSPDDRARFEWLYAKSLAHNHQATQAADEIMSLPESVASVPMLERQAFYSAMAGKHLEAVALYESLLKKARVEEPENLARTSLTYGYSLFKLKRFADAKLALQTAIAESEKLRPEKAGGERLTDFHPVRLQLIAYGLLGQLEEKSVARSALIRRGELLEASQKLVDDWLPLLIQNRMQLAAIDEANQKKWMAEALRRTQEYGDKNQYLGNAVFRGLGGYLSAGLARGGGGQTDSSRDAEGTKRVREVYERTVKAIEAQKVSQLLLTFQKLKLQMLWAAYSKSVLNEVAPAAKSVGSLLLEGENLKDGLPIQWQELQQLATALK